MDESSLLHELFRLKRIEKEYNNSQGRVNKDVNNDNDLQSEPTLEKKVLKEKEKVEFHNKHSVIFVNPSKINSFKQTDSLKNAQLLSSSPSQSVSKTKIYVNPNFKNSVVPSFQNDFSQRKGNTTDLGCDKTNMHSETTNFDKKVADLKIHGNNQESNHGISNEPPADSFSVKNIQKIYINQHFTKSVREGANSSKLVGQKLNNESASTGPSCKNLSPASCSLRNCTASVGGSVEVSNKELSSDFMKKPILHVKQVIKTKEPLNFENTKKYQISNTILDQKIFLNPKFRKKLTGSKTSSGNSLENHLTVNNSHTSFGKDVESSWLNTVPKDGIVKRNQEHVSLKSTTSQSLPDYGQPMAGNNSKKAVLRTRTTSTCLVSVSATKIVRRRKSNLKIEPNLTGSSNKLLFLSKTKLVRNALFKNSTESNSCLTSKLVRNDLNLKSKFKSLLTKNNLQRSTPVKLNTLSKKSLTSSDFSIVDIAPKSRCVPKMKSVNGKSLQLLKSHDGSNELIKTSHVKSTLNQPLFLSTTKLVRKSVLGKTMGNDKKTELNVAENDILTKTKLVSPKNHLQYLTLQKIKNQCKQNALCGTDISNNVSKLSHVTKIRSNNGKSLKLVQNSELPQRYLTANTSEKYSTVLKRKQLLRQQMNKNVMCMFRSKSRKTQFSKINVSVKKLSSQPRCRSKYVYQSKDLISRRQLTKAAILNRRGSFGKVETSLPTDKTKYIKSKYNLIRKNSHHPYSSLKVNKDTSPSKLESRLKFKLKMQHSLCKKHCKRKQLSIVNIGGVFYQCSRTSLTRNKPRPKQVLQKNNDGIILHIHGQKFKLERNGLTLTCLEKNPKRKRVDIGGVTFISSSSGTSLTRTNYHTARSILVHAKQKRISLLTRKLKKNNEPCLFFHRFGKCSGKERETCVRQHDPKNVAVCKKFVQGSCSDVLCLLSHNISCHNMPTCQHFLAGHCSRDHCLYPHIKVSDSAPICLDFLKGYCQLGDQCTKRHQDICPSFEKGVCPRGKYCPYPHPKSKSGKSLSRLTVFRKLKPLRGAEVVSSSNLRYFDDVNLQKENKQEPEEEGHKKSEEECISEEEDRRLFRNRPKLGVLPSFIPLTDDVYCGGN